MRPIDANSRRIELVFLMRIAAQFPLRNFKYDDSAYPAILKEVGSIDPDNLFGRDRILVWHLPPKASVGSADVADITNSSAFEVKNYASSL